MPRAEQLILPIVGLTLITAGTPASQTILSEKTRGLLVGTAGLLNVTIAGVVHTSVPFSAGVTPGFFESVESGGTAINIWGIT